jgi:hypothetical protein
MWEILSMREMNSGEILLALEWSFFKSMSISVIRLMKSLTVVDWCKVSNISVILEVRRMATWRIFLPSYDLGYERIRLY